MRRATPNGRFVLVGLLLVTCAAGCWTSAAPAPASRATTCSIREIVVDTPSTAKLSVRNHPFAVVSGPFVKLEIVVSGSEARARVETEQLELDGDLALDELPLRPKQVALRDGWLEVTRAIGRAAYDGSLRLEVDLPTGLLPRWTSIDVPCDQLTAARPPEPPTLAGAREIELPAGTSTRLFRAPGASPIGSWTSPKRSPDDDVPHERLTARVIERRGGYLRVRIQDRNAVIAWLAASTVRDLEDADVYGGLLGTESGETGNEVRCPTAVPIYVRADDRVVRVGRLKADATVLAKRVHRGDIELALGQTTATPFLQRKDLAGCTHP
jgi:hypothetical protein